MAVLTKSGWNRAGVPLAIRPSGWGMALGCSGLLLVLVLLPPFVPEPFRSFVMLVFEPLCHQMPGRSFHVHGHQLAVCHRCLGMYAGLFAGAFLFGYVRRWDAFLMRCSGLILVMAIAVPGIDWALGFTGLWANTTFSQTATGAFFGITAGYYFARACARTRVGDAREPVRSMFTRARS
ncbi:MAG TPA: DUF2085 domain-containing protein [Rhodothermales bacterium]|nr:DUF2085 domain-containing protein [Rhodothermales bacterium]